MATWTSSSLGVSWWAEHPLSKEKTCKGLQQLRKRGADQCFVPSWLLFLLIARLRIPENRGISWKIFTLSSTHCTDLNCRDNCHCWTTKPLIQSLTDWKVKQAQTLMAILDERRLRHEIQSPMHSCQLCNSSCAIDLLPLFHSVRHLATVNTVTWSHAASSQKKI